MSTETTFDGTYTDDTIATGTDPWVEVDGERVNWMDKNLPAALGNDCESCADAPVPGVLEAMNTPDGIQRCDECERFEGDLDAALALAALVGGTVKYLREDDEEEG